MKRFWKEVAVVPADEGFGIELDGRPVRTPAKAACAVPVPALAEAIAKEWRAQGDQVAPLTMPLTRAANATIDRVMPALAEVQGMVAAYGGTDLLCYRAPAPEALAARQAAAWDPPLAWAEQRFGARLVPAAGIVFQAQDPGALARLEAEVAALDAWRLTALHELVSLSSSLVLGLAVLHRHLTPGAAWEASRIDETWNIEHWGEDAEAAAQAARKETDFHAAARLLGFFDPTEQRP